jgi:hypothetical protein
VPYKLSFLHKKGIYKTTIFYSVAIHVDGLNLNDTHQLLAYADDVNILGGSVIL